ncbi:hypothetical protein [Heyndrickxia ginsengihumi]|nr:hypothetical protein [Heyndrickxia ginsengihumi]MCM3022276.1 hypothetical protein [Heyndrickxia ginsengihumi]
MERTNLTINGSGSYGGGLYGKVKVNGEAKVTDHLDCLLYSIRGKGQVMGNTKVETLSVFGEADLNGDLQANKVSVFGNCNVAGEGDIKNSVIRGSFKIDEKYNGERAEIKGELIVKSDVEVESFISKGHFHIDGLLNAEEIDISLRHGKSYAGEIGGKKINVRVPSSISDIFRGKKYLLLEARVIEGDDIYLENTKADIVRGQNIEIGPRCEINQIEYKGIYKKVKSSIVKEERKI